MVVGIIITLIVVIPIAILWVRGIDYMKKNHPDYKGEDFLDWDDNKIHSEGNF
jgi:hypothetical protein